MAADKPRAPEVAWLNELPQRLAHGLLQVVDFGADHVERLGTTAMQLV